MLITARSMRMLLEGAERTGIAVEPILASLDLDRARFASDAPSVPWPLFTQMCNEVSKAVEGNHERLAAIGIAMGDGPTNQRMHRISRTIVSPRLLFELVERWFARSSFPHVKLSTRFDGDRVTHEAELPASYEPCEAFFRIAVGSMASVPRFLGLPLCKIVAVEADGHHLHLELLLPKSQSIISAGIRAMTAVVTRKDRAEILEEERTLLAAGLVASQQSRNELRTVLENIPALVIIHLEGSIVFANRAIAKALGWRPENLIGMRLIDITDKRSHPLLFARVGQSTAAEYPELTEAWLVGRSGEPVAIEVAPPQSIEFDGASARLVVGRDINERDRLQKQLATADRLAALGLLAAGVAHEVNNPLAYLLNNIEMATRQLTTFGPRADTARQALQVALEGAHRIRFIVRELLLLAREDPTPAAAADLVGAVESTIALAKVEIARTARLTTDLEPVPFVRGSVPRIAQIVLNLVLNSLDAMRDRAASENELRIRIRRFDEGNVVLEIGDNGVGVSGPDAERIFLPFFTTKAAGKGTGLGLAVTQRLVNELGGEISFTSERHRGTTFRVLFPIANEEALPQTA